jgi:hypothetical protein
MPAFKFGKNMFLPQFSESTDAHESGDLDGPDRFSGDQNAVNVTKVFFRPTLTEEFKLHQNRVFHRGKRTEMSISGAVVMAVA